MIAVIGIVVSLYVLVRLLSNSKPWISKSISVTAVAITVFVLADLTIRTFTSESDGLLSLMHRDNASVTPASSSHSNAAIETKGARTSSVTRADGGSITTVLGLGIAVAKGSSLKREWIAVHDSTIPVAFDGTPGISTLYVSRQYGGEYQYRTKITIGARDAVRALEIRFLTFDVWGEHVRTLSLEEVADIAPNSKKEIIGEWALHSENDVEKHYASIAYIARVRLADGRVVEAPTESVIEEARKLSEKFTAAELEPKPPAPTSG
jgi:hypothetical protein